MYRHPASDRDDHETKNERNARLMYPSRWEVESVEISSCADIFLKALEARSQSPGRRPLPPQRRPGGIQRSYHAPTKKGPQSSFFEKGSSRHRSQYGKPEPRSISTEGSKHGHIVDSPLRPGVVHVTGSAQTPSDCQKQLKKNDGGDNGNLDQEEDEDIISECSTASYNNQVDDKYTCHKQMEQSCYHTPTSATTTTAASYSNPGSVYMRSLPPQICQVVSPPPLSSSTSGHHATGHRNNNYEQRRSQHTHQSVSPAVSPIPPKRKELEVSPGVFLPLHGSAETLAAMRTGRLTPCYCISCSEPLYCMDSVAYVLCPGCRVVSPTNFKVDLATSCMMGVGLGMRARVYQSWRQEHGEDR